MVQKGVRESGNKRRDGERLFGFREYQKSEVALPSSVK
jgi:hypothetical protein